MEMLFRGWIKVYCVWANLYSDLTNQTLDQNLGCEEDSRIHVEKHCDCVGKFLVAFATSPPCFVFDGCFIVILGIWVSKLVVNCYYVILIVDRLQQEISIGVQIILLISRILSLWVYIYVMVQYNNIHGLHSSLS